VCEHFSLSLEWQVAKIANYKSWIVIPHGRLRFAASRGGNVVIIGLVVESCGGREVSRSTDGGRSSAPNHRIESVRRRLGFYFLPT